MTYFSALPLLLLRLRLPRRLFWGCSARVASMCPSTQLRLVIAFVLCLPCFLLFANAWLLTCICRGASILKLVEIRRGRELLFSEGILLVLFSSGLLFNIVGAWKIQSDNSSGCSVSLMSNVGVAKNQVVSDRCLWYQFWLKIKFDDHYCCCA